MSKERINIEIDEQLKRDVKTKAASQGKTVKEIIINLLTKWLKK